MSNKLSLNYIDYIDIEPFKLILESIDDEEWDKFDFRQKAFEAHKHTKTLPIIFDLDGRIENPTYQILYKKFINPIEKVEEKLFDRFGYGYILRLLLTKLVGGGSISGHEDHGISLELPHRIHIPIITNKNVLFNVGGETINMGVGEMWEMDNQKTHSVVNNSDLDRVHLIVDWMTYE